MLNYDDNEMVMMDDDDDDTMEVLEETVKTLKSQNDHLLILSEMVRKNAIAIRKLDDGYETLKKDIRFIADNEYVSPAERQKIADAVKNRVTDILRIKNFTPRQYKYYYRQFAKKIWIDAKRDSMAVGRGGVYTKHRHYKEVINYIGVWEPEGYGIDGYFEHLRMIRSAS